MDDTTYIENRSSGKTAGPETFAWPEGYPDMMGKPQPAHMGSQSSAPSKEEPSSLTRDQILNTIKRVK